MEKLKVNQVFNKFRNIRALVIGDAMVDTYLWGNVDRISPEAPVPIVSVHRNEERLGGAANVSLNLQALGATPVLFSIIGEDNKGDTFMQLMEKHNLSQEGILRSESRTTTVKMRILRGTQQIVRVDEEISNYISKDEEKLFIEKISALIEKQHFDILLFVDYDKGIITPNVIKKITLLAHKKNILIAVDPKKRNFNLYKEVDLFKPNFNEFKAGLEANINKNDIGEILNAANTFKKKKELGTIFITLSELGVLISNGIKENHFPAEIRDIADVSGAGDTVLAVASLCLAAGMPTKFIAQLSNLAGGLVCEKSGVVPIDQERLKVEAQKIKITN